MSAFCFVHSNILCTYSKTAIVLELYWLYFILVEHPGLTQYHPSGGRLTVRVCVTKVELCSLLRVLCLSICVLLGGYTACTQLLPSRISQPRQVVRISHCSR
jgi:hypothetical protein